MIIGDGVMLGSGGERATIRVTGLTQDDYVTCTKEGRNYLGRWVTDHYEFVVGKYGTYTITATNGTDTATKEVLVDAAEVFEVEIAKEVTL